MITVSYKIKEMFFDRPAVMKAVGKSKKGTLSKAGAFVRRAARTSIRRRKAISAPGSPPSAHSTDPFATIKNILFGWDPSIDGVVVGPVGFGGRKSGVAPGDVPNVLEFGGVISRKAPVRRASGRRASPAQAAAFRRKIANKSLPAGQQPQRVLSQATYKDRPFMGPAVAKEAPKFPGLFKNSIVKGS